MALSRETREAYEETYALAVLGEARLMLGDPEAGRRDLDAAAAALPQVGLPWHRGGILVHLAAGRQRKGRWPAPWQPPTKRSRWPKRKTFAKYGCKVTDTGAGAERKISGVDGASQK